MTTRPGLCGTSKSAGSLRAHTQGFVRLASEVIRKSATLHMQHKSVLQERSSLARQSVQKIEEAAAAKLKAEEDAAGLLDIWSTAV
jgi:hypothetical protein